MKHTWAAARSFAAAQVFSVFFLLIYPPTAGAAPQIWDAAPKAALMHFCTLPGLSQSPMTTL